MDGMGHQHPAQFARPLAAPRHLVIFGGPLPQRFGGGDIGLAGNPGIDDRLGLPDAIAITVLEDRHQPTPGGLFGFDHLVDLRQRADQRLFADHVPASLQRRHDLPVMHHRRRADIDDVDIVHAQQFVKRGEPPLDAELVPDGLKPVRVEVADRHHSELVGIGYIAFKDMAAPDAATDDSDVIDLLAHRAFQSEMASAICCAASASSIALKQWAWLIAVSVRSRMSASNCRP
jgi:hypothetical protein